MISISKHNPMIRCYVDGRRELLEDIDVVFNGIRFTVKTGFTCDGSSVPVFFHRALGSNTTGPNLLSGIIHDNTYRYKFFDRESCDKILYESLILLGKPRWASSLMFWAVRIFGHKAYRDNASHY